MALAGASLIGAQPAVAQNHLMPATPAKGFWLEASHPNFKDLDVTLGSTVWFASGRLPLTSNLRGVAEVPFAYAEMDDVATEGNSVLGNPYLGLELEASSGILLEAGARLPVTTADENSFADMVGALAEPYRGEAFQLDVVPLYAGVNVMRALPSGFGFRARGGLMSAIYTGDDDLQETNHFLDYGALGTYQIDRARFGAGVSGRWNASADEGDFGDNSLHRLGLSADVRARGVRPGITLHVPLDEDYRDVVGPSVGLYLQVPLR